MTIKGWLPSTKLLYVDNSPIHGKGVFARLPIRRRELFEIAPFIVLDIERASLPTTSPILWNFAFKFQRERDGFVYIGIGLGFACLYNHSNTPSASVRWNLVTNTMEFYATHNIKEKEEIFIDYGVDWFKNRPHIEMK